jgi:tetratricopeptide (TPR) repeat protein
VQAARDEKKADARASLLAQGTSYLARAAESAPDDPLVRFNYAYALFLNGKYAEAAEQLRPVITADPRDGQAYFLFAKSLERTGKAEQASAADDQARRYLPVYAKWQTDWQKSQMAPSVSLRMRMTFNRNDYFNAIRSSSSSESDEPQTANASNASEVLAKARSLYTAGQDDAALSELRRVLTIEPTSAEAYLLIGKINARRGAQDVAISALQTAIFWDADAKLIDAHILLGRIYLQRKDRAKAAAYARSALTIDPNNQEALALQRQTEINSK